MLQERMRAVQLKALGKTVREIAEQLQRSEPWVRKWLKRYEQLGMAGLEDQSRKPHTSPQRISQQMRAAIIDARLILEQRQIDPDYTGLRHIGGRAIRSYLVTKGLNNVPSIPTIERVLRRANLTKPREKEEQPKIKYPQLTPKQAGELIQIDIVPRFLTGGQKIACFNSIDTVSRYAYGAAFETRTARTARDFLLMVCKASGIPNYTQLDNESCFSGGFTHKYVLGQTIRAGLLLGTQLLFSPTYHPQSNCFVERFHQEYDEHVWRYTNLKDLAEIAEKAELFFKADRLSTHKESLDGQPPEEIHWNSSQRFPCQDLSLGEDKLPLYSGQVHFMRQVEKNATIRLLNHSWPVAADANTGVWATLELQPDQSTLAIYNKAPDQSDRTRLNAYRFPVSDPVLPWSEDLLDTYLHQPIQNTVSVEPELFDHLDDQLDLRALFIGNRLGLHANLFFETMY